MLTMQQLNTDTGQLCATSTQKACRLYCRSVVNCHKQHFCKQRCPLALTAINPRCQASLQGQQAAMQEVSSDNINDTLAANG